MVTKLVSITNMRLWVLYLLSGFILLVGNACAENSVDEPVNNTNAVLSEHQWVLSTVSYREENKDVGALKPVYFQFNIERDLLLVTTPCEGTDDRIIKYGFDILFLEEQHYILVAQASILPSCGEVIDEQTEYLRISDTSQYEIRGEQLILTGKNIQIVLESDDANP